MLRIFYLLLFTLYSLSVSAKQDSLFIRVKNSEWYISHKVKLGENLFILSRRYHVPPAIFADANGVDYTDGLEDGKKILIPLGAYNRISQKPDNMSEARPLYFRVREHDNLFTISHYAGVKQRVMQKWNDLPDNEIEPGQVLLVGYVLFDATQVPFAAKDKPGRKDSVAKGANKQGTVQNNIQIQQYDPFKSNKGEQVTVIKVPPADTAAPVSEEEALYLRQTNNGLNVVEEKGPAVFYFNSGKVSSTNTFFAFHNTARRGAIIKVHNPGTDRTVYVKVLGPIPATKQYYNCIIGISGGAKRMLGINENKSWCELSYAVF